MESGNGQCNRFVTPAKIGQPFPGFDRADGGVRHDDGPVGIHIVGWLEGPCIGNSSV